MGYILVNIYLYFDAIRFCDNVYAYIVNIKGFCQSNITEVPVIKDMVV